MSKIFSFDLDGTLLNDNGVLHHNNLKYLNDAKRKGSTLVINTGRGVSSTVTIRKESGNIFDYVLANNGTVLVDVKDDNKLTFLNKLDVSVIEKIVPLVALYEPMLIVHTEKESNFHKLFSEDSEPEWYANDEEFKNWAIENRHFYTFDQLMKKLKSETATQITLRASKETAGLMEGLIKEQLGDFVDVAVSSELYVDINPKNSGKFSGLEKLCSIIGCDATDVIAFGDSGNDVSKLKNCKKSFAMENATYEAKDAAKTIIGNNNSDALGLQVLNIIYEFE